MTATRETKPTAPSDTKTDRKPRRRKQKAPKLGPSALGGSLGARRQAVVLLEVLSGATGPQAASDTLGISLNRYYQLETRALQGFIDALEPRPRGKQPSTASKLAQATESQERLQRELTRYQALLRAAQRALGLKQDRNRATLAGKSRPGTVAKKTKRKRRATVPRAARVVAALSKDAEAASKPTPAASSGTTS